MRSQKSPLAKIDWFLVFLYLSLAVIGWLMLYAAEFDPQSTASFFSLKNPVAMQAIWIVASLILYCLIFLIDDKFWSSVSYLVYMLSIIVLVAVLFIGSTKKGSTSWISVFGFSFQPAEFAKLGACLTLANYLSYYKTQLSSTKSQLISAGIFLFPAALILLQPDAGSAIVFLSLSVMMYRAGLSPVWLVLFFCLALLFILSFVLPLYLLWALVLLIGNIFFLGQILKNRTQLYLSIGLLIVAFIGLRNAAQFLMFGMALLFVILSAQLFLKSSFRLALIPVLLALMAIGFSFSANYVFDHFLEPHQQDRINVWLRPELSDPRGSMYNVLQSKLAISSGELEGKGFLKGTLTKLNYVPEQTTDFIFSIIGEEQGFLGAMAIIVIFVLLLIRLTTLAERMRSEFNTYFTYGLAGFIFVHFFINIGMTMGLLPVIGIPLPFISKGGSSFLVFSVMLAIITKMDSNRLGR